MEEEERHANGQMLLRRFKDSTSHMGFDKISLKGRALRLLAGREHSRAELERKLASHEEAPGELRAALDDLQSKGFINDSRVVESVVYRRASRLGASRIRQEALRDVQMVYAVLRGEGVSLPA